MFGFTSASAERRLLSFAFSEAFRLPDPTEEKIKVENQEQVKQKQAKEAAEKASAPEGLDADVRKQVDERVEAAAERTTQMRQDIEGARKRAETRRQQNVKGARDADTAAYVGEVAMAAPVAPFVEETRTETTSPVTLAQAPASSVDTQVRTKTEQAQKTAKEAAAPEGGNAGIERPDVRSEGRA